METIKTNVNFIATHTRTERLEIAATILGVRSYRTDMDRPELAHFVVMGPSTCTAADTRDHAARLADSLAVYGFGAVEYGSPVRRGDGGYEVCVSVNVGL